MHPSQDVRQASRLLRHVHDARRLEAHPAAAASASASAQAPAEKYLCATLHELQPLPEHGNHQNLSFSDAPSGDRTMQPTDSEHAMPSGPELLLAPPAAIVVSMAVQMSTTWHLWNMGSKGSNQVSMVASSFPVAYTLP
ncbi:hypothetical protein VTL71DRAFT_298 [Oculimacula yallundae]|uniref:Uncharacterized protein n=1 Tax=Oculimacula yallundae TaxID=86028 RepID=A0ABR4CZL4_9HELO